jgi:hypothetical protein
MFMTEQAPVITSYTLDTALAAGGDSLPDNVLTLGGTATPDSTVESFDGDILLGAAAVDANGNWSFAVPATQASYNLTAVDANAEGTPQSAASPLLAINTTALSPSAPSATALTPSIAVDPANPASVNLYIAGLATGDTGAVTFKDANGNADTINVATNGATTTDLSNLQDGSITYTLTVNDSTGKTVATIDPGTTLGPSGYADGSANAPGGTS